MSPSLLLFPELLDEADAEEVEVLVLIGSEEEIEEGFPTEEENSEEGKVTPEVEETGTELVTLELCAVAVVQEAIIALIARRLSNGFFLE